MPHRCCVPLCTSDARWKEYKKMSFHSFPKDGSLQQTWIQHIRRGVGKNFNFRLTIHTRICSKHFNESCYEAAVLGQVRKRLRKNAVPTVFSWTATEPTRRKLVRDETPQLSQQCQSATKEESVVSIDHCYVTSSVAVEEEVMEEDGTEEAEDASIDLNDSHTSETNTMPKLKKKSGAISRRRKYHYMKKSDAFHGTEGTHRLVDPEPLSDLLEGTSGSPTHCELETSCSTREDELQTVERNEDHLYAKSVVEWSDADVTSSEDARLDCSHIKIELEVVTHEEDVQTSERNEDYKGAVEWRDVDVTSSEDSRLDCDSAGEDDHNHTNVELEEVTVESASFQSLAADIRNRFSSGNYYDYLIRQSEEDIVLLKMYGWDNTSVKLSVRIDAEFICIITVHRKLLDRSHSIWKDMPAVFDNVDSVFILLDKIELMSVCCGNTEEEYHDLVPIGGGLTNSVDVDIVAYREGDFGAISSTGLPYSSTIRAIKCTMLTERKMKCSVCASYGYALKKRHKRLHERNHSGKTFNHSSFKHKDMTRYELCKKLREQKAEIDSLQQTVWKLSRQYEKMIRGGGIPVQDHEHCLHS